MSTNTILALVVGAAVVAGGGYWYMTSSNTGASMSDSMSESMDGSAAGGTQLAGGQTFASIMASGQNVQCEYTYDSGNDMSSGTVYIADGGERFRGDFTITSPVAMQASVIRDGGYNYVWGSSFPQGIKTAVTAENRNEMFSSDNASVPDDVQYHCTPWSVDASVFALPSSVEFMDVGAQMQGMMQMEGSANVKAMQCAACDNIEGNGRAACRAALSCN